MCDRTPTDCWNEVGPLGKHFEPSSALFFLRGHILICGLLFASEKDPNEYYIDYIFYQYAIKVSNIPNSISYFFACSTEQGRTVNLLYFWPLLPRKLGMNFSIQMQIGQCLGVEQPGFRLSFLIL